jgi:hypothetical protein
MELRGEGGSISSAHSPNEEEEAKFVELDDIVQVRSFHPRFETSRLLGWERQKRFNSETRFFSKKPLPGFQSLVGSLGQKVCQPAETH